MLDMTERFLEKILKEVWRNSMYMMYQLKYYWFGVFKISEVVYFNTTRPYYLITISRSDFTESYLQNWDGNAMFIFHYSIICFVAFEDMFPCLYGHSTVIYFTCDNQCKMGETLSKASKEKNDSVTNILDGNGNKILEIPNLYNLCRYLI